MHSCPCCSDPLLRHIQGAHTYWFCRNCWQEMPILKDVSINYFIANEKSLNDLLQPNYAR